MILVSFFKIPHGDRLAKNIKSRCVQVLPRSATERSSSIIVFVHGEEKEIKIIKNQEIWKKKEQNPLRFYISSAGI